jgi:hypothetical protein
LAATFRGGLGFHGMKTFLKVLLIVALAILAVKLLPITLVAGCIFAVGVALLAAVGVSLVALGLCISLAIAALLSPIWIPVLALVGIIALIKRHRRAPIVA